LHRIHALFGRVVREGPGLIWPSLEGSHPTEQVIIFRHGGLRVGADGALEPRLSAGSVGTVLIRLCGRDVLRVPISSGWHPSPHRRLSLLNVTNYVRTHR
jgi:hypothetical protein